MTADLAAVRADDALLDVLGGRDPGMPADALTDDLSVLLHDWRHACDADPASQLVTTRQARRAIHHASNSTTRSTR